MFMVYRIITVREDIYERDKKDFGAFAGYVHDRHMFVRMQEGSRQQ